MSIFVVPEPLFNRDMHVEAYWLRCSNGKKPLGLRDDFARMDAAFAHLGLNVIEPIGIEPLTGGCPLFVFLTRTQLMAGVPLKIHLPARMMICVVPVECAHETSVLQAVQTLRERGYTIALGGLPNRNSALILEYVRYICTDYKSFLNRYADCKQLIGDREMVAYGIPSMDTFSRISSRGNVLCAGNFYNQPITKRRSSLSPVKINALNLLRQVNREDFELEDIIRTIGRDPYLSVSLLKYINSGKAVRNRQVDSIQQAVAILGQDAVRRWATISLSTTLGEDRPNEITKQALVRAKFAEGVAGAFEMGVYQSSLFIAGLFSLLDIMLDKPMDQALRDVSVNEMIWNALVDHKGPLYPVMEMVYAYERADWDRVGILMIQYSADMNQISKTYLDALAWYRDLLRSIDSHQD